MTEYIKREDVLALSHYDDHDCEIVDVEDVEKLPAADVRPVKRGRWKPHDLTWGRSYYYCTACEQAVDMPTEMGVPIYKYCPFCGAKQEEEK